MTLREVFCWMLSVNADGSGEISYTDMDLPDAYAPVIDASDPEFPFLTNGFILKMDRFELDDGDVEEFAFSWRDDPSAAQTGMPPEEAIAVTPSPTVASEDATVTEEVFDWTPDPLWLPFRAPWYDWTVIEEE